MITHHSEFGIIQSLYLKSAKSAFISQQILESQWKELNYLSMPDYQESLTEYTGFENIFKEHGVDVSHFSMNDSVMIDSIYCRDASIATDFGVILCTMGKAGRKNEPIAAAGDYSTKDIKVLGSITAPGTVEGGDVCWLDDKTLAVGRTYRTNQEGINQLKALLEPNGVTIVVADLPHFRGPSDVFHLMSILSPVDKDLAVVYSPLMPIRFREELLNRNIKLVEVPESEYDSMGCNVLAIAPRVCVVVEGNPLTKAALQDAGAQVITYKGHEISVKGGGGPTCLTRPFLRKL